MRRKQTAKEQAQGFGCLVLIGLALVIYLSSNRDGSYTPRPTPNAPNYGQRVDVADEWVELPAGVAFRSCPLLECRVMATSGENERAFIIRMEAGEIVDGIELWAMVEAQHQQQGRALALLTAVKAALGEANKQLTEKAILDAEMMTGLWESGIEHGQAELRQEMTDMITNLIDRDPEVVERALTIFFDGGVLDEFAVTSLDDLILHISTDSRIAEANNFDPIEFEED